MNMKRTSVFLAALAAIVCCAASSTAYANYSVANEGQWPKSWPKQLEPLRKQSTTFVGPMVERLHYHIPFAKREDFESAWPHILKVKTKGASLVLLRSPCARFGKMDAGVIIHCPPAGTKPEVVPPGEGDNMYRIMRTNYIELIVDGKIVDLNRLPLPADTPIIDKRFVEERKEPPQRRAKSVVPPPSRISPAAPASGAPQPPASSQRGG
jgi:hypothetical protein